MSPMMNLISAPTAPAANGHYSHAAVWRDLVFTATQLPIDPHDPHRRPSSVADQARHAPSNVRQILRAAGPDLSAVVRLTIYMTDMTHWPDVDAVCRALFGAHKPPRGVVAVAGLHLGFNVAIDAIGIVPRINS